MSPKRTAKLAAKPLNPQGISADPPGYPRPAEGRFITGFLLLFSP